MFYSNIMMLMAEWSVC